MDHDIAGESTTHPVVNGKVVHKPERNAIYLKIGRFSKGAGMWFASIAHETKEAAVVDNNSYEEWFVAKIDIPLEYKK